MIYENINYKLPVLLAKQSIKHGAKHFIQISTIAVYGNQSSISVKSQPSPINLYGYSKLKADDELLALNGQNIIVSVIRPSMVYGAPNAPGNMMKIINIVKKQFPLPFLGINNKRQFLHIKNFCGVLEYIINNSISGIILVADPFTVSISELISLISKSLSKNDTQFSLKILWRIFRFLSPNLTNKLIDDLIIQNTLDYSTNEIKVFSIEDGIKAMIHNGL